MRFDDVRLTPNKGLSLHGKTKRMSDKRTELSKLGEFGLIERLSEGVQLQHKTR